MQFINYIDAAAGACRDHQQDVLSERQSKKRENYVAKDRRHDNPG